MIQKKTLGIISSVLTVMVLVSGCSLFGGTPASPTPTTSPNQVLRDMQGKLYDREMSSGNVSGSLSFDIQQNKDTMKIAVAIDTDFDVKTKNEEKFQVNTLSISGEGNPEGTIVKGGAELELRYLKQNIFFLLKNITLPDMKESGLSIEQMEALITPFKGSWYKYALPEGVSPFSISSTSETNVDSEKEEKIKELIKKTDFFTVTKDHGVEKISGVDAYHYTVSLNEDGMITFAQEAGKIMGEEMSESDINELRDTLKNNAKMNGDLWIGVKDLYVYKGKFDLHIDNEKEGMKGVFSGELTLDPNKKVSVTEPANAKDLIEEIGALMSPSMENYNETVDPSAFGDE